MGQTQPNVWSGGDAYERKRAGGAPLFTEWIGVSARADWLDIGCGTGVLTSVVLGTCAPSRVTRIDSAANFLDAAATQGRDSRVSFKQGVCTGDPGS